jgi:hypothetical protein
VVVNDAAVVLKFQFVRQAPGNLVTANASIGSTNRAGDFEGTFLMINPCLNFVAYCSCPQTIAFTTRNSTGSLTRDILAAMRVQRTKR